MKLKRTLAISVGVLAMLGLRGETAQADPLNLYFCPGHLTCPSGITATLNFDDMSALYPSYDYVITLTFAGDATSPAYVDDVQFDDGIKGSEYQSPTPVLLSAPAGPWDTYFNNISGSSNGCTSSNLNKHSVCSSSPGLTNYGAPLNAANDYTASFVYGVNLNDGVDTPTLSSNWNLRAQFLNADGSNAGILSPDGTFKVAEPSTLVLLGTGLAFVGMRRRRRNK